MSQQLLELKVNPQEGFDEESLRVYLTSILKLSENDTLDFRITKRSIDARSKSPLVNLWLDVAVNQKLLLPETNAPQYQDVRNSSEVHIIGAGPAGLFAALRLIELGIKPVIFERGKNVRDRRRDLAAINQKHIVNTESNYCFGEGGAGTYSDGKLYTRSHKRGNVDSVLQTFYAHGASPQIMIDTHPHIGTNKLPGIITAMRNTIENCGGEVHFEKKLTNIDYSNGEIKSITLNTNERVQVRALILATGHSARDVYELLHTSGIALEFKPFALGVRIEHPQALIDEIQYHQKVKNAYLPPASYSLVHQVQGRGVYSFCMCPGGIIAPCATNPGEVVTNGWSPSKRNNPYANSGIVVEINEGDARNFQHHGALMGMYFQQNIEQLACQMAGNTQAVPAQRMADFVNRKLSLSLPETSYQPGLSSQVLDEVLPEAVSGRLREAFKVFGQKMRGYLTNEAVLHAVESRTSTPVRIPRDSETLQHQQVKGLFPCGEGAGYAGGIVSAAIDGQRVAEKIKQFLSGF
jgi:uncharacterized FAD-dependent dehydrogenase